MQALGHAAEYVGRDCLDLLLCLDASASAAPAGGLHLHLRGATAVQPLQPGPVPTADTPGGSRATDWPLYLVNDIHLLTVLESVRLALGG